MKSIEELEQELLEAEAEGESLASSMGTSRVDDLTGLISKSGKMKGHLTGLTAKQYEKLIGRPPAPGLLTKSRDATTRKVQWDMVLDQLATERGYKSDEALKEAIEQAHDNQEELEGIKSSVKYLRDAILDKLKAEPEVETIKLDDTCPQFPNSTCEAEVTLMNGMSFRLRRQHSYWRVDTGDKSFRIRYAIDARKLGRVIEKDFKTKMVAERTEKFKRKKLYRPRRLKRQVSHDRPPTTLMRLR